MNEYPFLHPEVIEEKDEYEESVGTESEATEALETIKGRESEIDINAKRNTITAEDDSEDEKTVEDPDEEPEPVKEEEEDRPKSKWINSEIKAQSWIDTIYSTTKRFTIRLYNVKTRLTVKPSDFTDVSFVEFILPTVFRGNVIRFSSDEEVRFSGFAVNPFEVKIVIYKKNGKMVTISHKLVYKPLGITWNL